MKKNLIIVSCLAITLIISGCSNTNTNSNAKSGANTSGSIPVAKEASQQNSSQKGSGDRPKMDPPSLFGQVDRIIGNEVTLRVAEMPKRTGGEKPQGNNGTNSNSSGQNTSPISGMSGGAPGGMGEGRNGGVRKMELKFSGESVKIIIPVGVPIESSSGGGKSEELELTDITAGTNIMLWKDQSGSIIRVRVMKGASQ